jgi:hypothetical protein
MLLKPKMERRDDEANRIAELFNGQSFGPLRNEAKKWLLEASAESFLGKLRDRWSQEDDKLDHVQRAFVDTYEQSSPVEFLAMSVLVGVRPPLEILLALSVQFHWYLAAEGSMSLDAALFGEKGRKIKAKGNLANQRARSRNAKSRDEKKSKARTAAASLRAANPSISLEQIVESFLNDDKYAHFARGISDDTAKKWLANLD